MSKPSEAEIEAELNRLKEEHRRLLQSSVYQSGTTGPSTSTAEESTEQALPEAASTTSFQNNILDVSNNLLDFAMADQHNLTVAPYFADKIETSIQRLKGNNWATWKWQLTNVLDAKGLTDVLDSQEPRGSPREIAARQIISSSLDSTLVCKVVHCQTAQQIWSCLRGIYENRTSFALTDLIGKMNSYRMVSLDDVENGISEIQNMACQIKALNGSADNSTIESAILRALPKSFSAFVTSWTFLDAEKRTLDNLHAHIMRTVSQLRFDEVTINRDKVLMAQGRIKSSRPPKSSKSHQGNRDSSNHRASKSNSDKRAFCRYCKEKDHVIDNCKKLAKKREKDGTARPSSSHTEASPVSSNPSSRDHLDTSISPNEDMTASARVAFGYVATLDKGVSCLRASTNDLDYSCDKYVRTTWLADSGASFHMTSHREWMAGYEELHPPLSVRMGDNFVLLAVGKGFIETSNGLIDPVYYLPKIKENLFSTSFCAKYHKIFSVNTDKDIRFFREPDEQLFRGFLNNCGMYEIIFTVKLAKYVAFMSKSLTNWHDRLGHVSTDVIKHMARNNIVEGLKISEVPKTRCESCAYGKQTRASHPTKMTSRGSYSGEILHFDTIGPIPDLSLGGAKYYVLCKDSHSNYRQVFFTSDKSSIPTKVKQIITRTSIQTGHEVRQIHTDNGSEFSNAELLIFLGEKGIVLTNSATYTAEQNGFIERDIRTVAEMARTMRIRASLDKSFWAEAIATAVYNLNRVVNSTNNQTTPYELWFGRKPSLKNLHRFGEQAIVYVEKRYRDKLDAKGEKLTFVGYTDVYNTYRFIDPKSGRLVISCNAIFLDTTVQDDLSNLQLEDNESSSDESDCIITSGGQQFANLNSGETSILSHYESPKGTRELISEPFSDCSVPTYKQNLETHQTHPSSSDENLSAYQNADNLREKPAVMSPENADRDRLATLRPRSNRPLYTGWKVNSTALLEDNPPKSAAEARRLPSWPKWKRAMQEEYDSLVKNNVFELVELPRNRNIKLMTCRWVFAQKKDGRYKARLVARGFEQIEGIHYFETYAPTPNMEDIRLFLAYAAVNNLLIAQFDIKTAFLNGEIDVEIYMRQPELYETNDNRVWLLKRSLYGLKQSPRQWSQKFTSFLIDIGLVESKENHCVFYKKDPLMIVAVYVDDGIIFARRQEDVDHIMSQLHAQFDVHTMDVATFLGFQIERPRDHQIILHQSDYIDKVLRTFADPTTTVQTSPISPCKLKPDETPLGDVSAYRQKVGSLLYAALTTRIDIAFAVHKASRSVANPTNSDSHLVERTMRYLSGTRSLGLSYTLERHNGFEVYTDADLAGCEETSRSTTGSVILFAGAPVFWRSSRQGSVTRSSTEAELVSLDQTVIDVMRITNLAFELGLVKPQTITIHCDNESVIHLVSNDRSCHRNKFQKIKCAFIREQVTKKVVQVKHVKTKNNLADMLTKSLPVKDFISARNKMMLSASAKVALLALLATCLLPHALSIKFDTTRPIVYEKTEHYVDDGDVEYTIDLTYENPSAIIIPYLPSEQAKASLPPGHRENAVVNFDAAQENYVKAFIRDTDAMYLSTWMRKVEDLFKVVVPKPLEESFPSHSIEKRSAVGTVVLGTCVYNFLSSVFAPYLPWSEYAKISKLEEFQQHEKHRLEQFRQQFNVTRAVEQGLLEMAAQNARSSRDLKKQLSFFSEMSQKLTWLSSLIQTRISFATSDLKTVINEAQSGRVATHELADLFNITDLSRINSQDTRLISITRVSTQTIRFNFYVNIHSTNTHIYHVHPFRFWANLTGRPELREYQGSSYVIYNKTTNCIRGIQKPVERTISERCIKSDFVDPKVTIWRTLLTDYDVDSQDVTNVLKTSFFNYIYCFPAKITLWSQTIFCPTQVFKLPLSVSFTTGSYSHEYVQRKIFGHIDNKFVDDINLAHFNDNSIATPDVAMFRRIQQYIQSDIKREQESEFEWRVSKQGPAIWSLAILILVLSLMVVCLIIYINQVIHRGQRKLSRCQKEVSTELKSLTSNYGIYQKMECSNCANVIKELKAMNSALTSSTSISSSTAQVKPFEVGRNESVNVHFHTNSPVTKTDAVSSI